jgi:hypothetical protein
MGLGIPFRFALAALAGGIALLVFGYKGCSDSIKFRAPIKMTAQEFLKKKPQEGWYEIKGGTMLLTEAKFEVHQGKYETKEPTVQNANIFYLPVHAGKNIDSKTTLVLKTNDASIKSHMIELDGANGVKPEEQEAWLAQHRDSIVVQRDIKGMIEAGVLPEGSDTNELSKLGEELGSDFVVIKEGTQPAGLGKGVGMAAGGVALLLLSGFVFLRMRK